MYHSLSVLSAARPSRCIPIHELVYIHDSREHEEYIRILVMVKRGFLSSSEKPTPKSIVFVGNVVRWGWVDGVDCFGSMMLRGQERVVSSESDASGLKDAVSS